MITLKQEGVYLLDGKTIAGENAMSKDEARENTIAYQILRAHDVRCLNGKGEARPEAAGDDRGQSPLKQGCMSPDMHIKFDAMVSHDITYVGIIQTARASGLTKFPLPYAMTNCHNSLCAVGGTINEDDHVFGLSAAKKYGGIYVPANQAVIHQYAR